MRDIDEAAGAQQENVFYRVYSRRIVVRREVLARALERRGGAGAS